MPIKIEDLSNFNWSPNSKHVDQKVKEGVTTASSNILIGVGPARYSDVSNEPVNGITAIAAEIVNRTPAQIVPLGVTSQATVTQQKGSRIVYEIGSKLQYNIPGNVSGSISLARMYLNNKSLMKALYAFKTPEQLDNLPADDVPGQLESPLWFNLASSLFDEPIGMMFWYKDNKSYNVGAYYYENCNVQGLTFSHYATGTSFSESTSLIFDRAVPIEVSKLRP